MSLKQFRVELNEQERQQLIAQLVPQAVIHQLKAVEVEKEDREPAVGVSLAGLDARAQAIHEHRAVGESGEFVMQDRVFDFGGALADQALQLLGLDRLGLLGDSFGPPDPQHAQAVMLERHQ